MGRTLSRGFTQMNADQKELKTVWETNYSNVLSFSFLIRVHLRKSAAKGSSHLPKVNER